MRHRPEKSVCLSTIHMPRPGFHIEMGHELKLTLAFGICGEDISMYIRNFVQPILLPFLQQENDVYFHVHDSSATVFKMFHIFPNRQDCQASPL